VKYTVAWIAEFDKLDAKQALLTLFQHLNLQLQDLLYFRLTRTESQKCRKQVFWKSCFVCDLEDFDFRHLEIQ
jgi:hypothetical protein